MERVRTKDSRPANGKGKHRFQKGNKMGGRKLGVQNKVTSQLKTAILEAAAMVGYDKRGAHGLHGYLARLAVKQPQVYGRLLEKILPMQIQGTVDVTDKRRAYETLDDLAQALKERGLPPPRKLIEVNPKAGVMEHV